MKAALFVSAVTCFTIGCSTNRPGFIVLGIILGIFAILETFQSKHEREKHHFNNNGHRKSKPLEWDEVDKAFYDDTKNLKN